MDILEFRVYRYAHYSWLLLNDVFDILIYKTYLWRYEIIPLLQRPINKQTKIRTDDEYYSFESDI